MKAADVCVECVLKGIDQIHPVMSPKAQQFSFPAQSDIHFDDFITRDRWKFAQQAAVVHLGVLPPANVYETREGFTIELVLPGILMSDLTFEIKEGQLLVSYTPDQTAFEPMNQQRTWRQEYRMPPFQRSFDIHPNIIEPDSMHLHLENGILSIAFIKRPELEGKMLPIMPFSLN